jgi:hypothetical protein
VLGWSRSGKRTGDARRARRWWRWLPSCESASCNALCLILGRQEHRPPSDSDPRARRVPCRLGPRAIPTRSSSPQPASRGPDDRPPAPRAPSPASGARPTPRRQSQPGSPSTPGVSAGLAQHPGRQHRARHHAHALVPGRHHRRPRVPASPAPYPRARGGALVNVANLSPVSFANISRPAVSFPRPASSGEGASRARAGRGNGTTTFVVAVGMAGRLQQ